MQQVRPRVKAVSQEAGAGRLRGGSRRGSVGAWLGRVVRLLLLLPLLWAGLVIGLGLLYGTAAPVSTLMLGRWLTFRPVAHGAVRLDAVARDLPLAVLTSEDQRFCLHDGVDWGALREVMEDEDASRGASTIPMQVAKNLFLWPGRSYLRKGLELPVALYLDLIWSKRRMMEVYLSVAEWGDGVFGAEAAARRHFGKSARDLTRREAALLAAALPNPILRDTARPTRRHLAAAARIAGRMPGAAPFAACLGR